MIIVDRFYRHLMFNGGFFLPIHTGQDLISPKRYTGSTMPYWGTPHKKYIPLFSQNDNKLYMLFSETTWIKGSAGVKTSVLRLRTRKNPQLLLGDIRHLGGNSGFLFFYSYNYAVDSRRNVIVGEVMEEGKPDWLVEYELEELFS